MPNDPSVTHPNLVISQLSVGSGSVLGGEGRVGVEWWHENHIRDQSSQAAPPTLCSSLASEDSMDGLSFPFFPP